MLPLKTLLRERQPKKLCTTKNDFLSCSHSCRKLIYCVTAAPDCLLSIVANDMRFICDIPQTTLYVNINTALIDWKLDI